MTIKIFMNSICFGFAPGQVIQQADAAGYFRSQLWGQVDKHIKSPGVFGRRRGKIDFPAETRLCVMFYCGCLMGSSLLYVSMY